MSLGSSGICLSLSKRTSTSPSLGRSSAGSAETRLAAEPITKSTPSVEATIRKSRRVEPSMRWHLRPPFAVSSIFAVRPAGLDKLSATVEHITHECASHFYVTWKLSECRPCPLKDKATTEVAWEGSHGMV